MRNNTGMRSSASNIQLTVRVVSRSRCALIRWKRSSPIWKAIVRVLLLFAMVVWDALYVQVTERLPEAEFITMDSAYKTPWIMKKILDDSRAPIVPYTRYKGKKGAYKPWDFVYDEGQDCFICPQGCQLRHTTTNKDGKRFYRSTPKDCRNCPCREQCGANEKDQRLLTITYGRSIWIWRSSCVRRSGARIYTLCANKLLNAFSPMPKTSMACVILTAAV